MTAGRIIAEGVDISFDGMCPVQGEGAVDGHGVYYRSRGRGWQFEVFERDANESPVIFQHFVRCYSWPEGGCIEAEESMKNIRRAVDLFRDRRRKREDDLVGLPR